MIFTKDLYKTTTMMIEYGEQLMKILNRTKILIKAGVVVAIALAFIMPATAMTYQTHIVDSNGLKTMGRGEWTEQASGFFTASRGIRNLDAVDNMTAWAIAYDGSGGNEATTDITMTSNGGDLWTPNIVLATSGYGLGNICGLNDDVAYVALFNQNGAQDSICGPYKTTNGGATWEILGDWSTPMSFCNNVWFWNENEGVVLGDSDTYFEDYYTMDGGATWTRVPLENYSGLPLQSGEAGWTGVVDVVGDTIVFGTNVGNAYISHDRGHTYYSAYTGASTGGTNAGVNDLAFKDDMHGLAAHDDGTSYSLYETSDGGITWAPVSYTGICYSSGLAYLPGTENKFVSTGAATGASGASYSVDGGHSWTDYAGQTGIQMLATDFVDGEIGWAGGFNTDEFTGGMFKHLPSANPLPAFSISVVGGKGFTVNITNIGDADATDVTCDIAITDGFFVTPKTFSGNETSLAIGATFTVTGAPLGIGLGIIKPVPKITITVNCHEDVNATRTVQAKILLKRIILQ
jgi:hypothetical protein